VVKKIGRIPAAQVTNVKPWLLPEVASANVIKVGTTTATAAGRKRDAIFTPAKPAPPRAPVASRSGVMRPSAGRPASGAPGQSGAPGGKDAPGEQNAAAESSADALDATVTPAAEPVVAVPAGPPPGPDEGYAAGLAQGLEEGTAQGHAEGYAKGLVEGQAEGLAKGEAAGREAATAAFETEVKNQKQALKGLLAGFAEPLQAIQAEMATLMMPLVTQISEAVLLSELKNHPEHIRKIVNAGLDAMPHGSSQVQVNVNPSVADFVRQLLSMSDAPVEVIEDKTLAVGSCRIHSAFTNIDSSLSRNLRRCLTQVFKEEADLQSQVEVVTESALLKSEEAFFDH
jgi:flagellar assembly protein FliH